MIGPGRLQEVDAEERLVVSLENVWYSILEKWSLMRGGHKGSFKCIAIHLN